MTGRQVVRNVPTGTRPEIPLECRPEIYELMMRTWRKDPRLRPTFTEARLELSRSLCQWEVNNDDDTSEYLDISGFSEDLEHGMVYFNRRIPEFECEIWYSDLIHLEPDFAPTPKTLDSINCCYTWFQGRSKSTACGAAWTLENSQNRTDYSPETRPKHHIQWLRVCTL